jgi:hypothetical protein
MTKVLAGFYKKDAERKRRWNGKEYYYLQEIEESKLVPVVSVEEHEGIKKIGDWR